MSNLRDGGPAGPWEKSKPGHSDGNTEEVPVQPGVENPPEPDDSLVDQMGNADGSNTDQDETDAAPTVGYAEGDGTAERASDELRGYDT